ncbi:MAG: molybdopterin-binding protein [Oscillospiraceae bacterium]|nr:molybdopterin-binding protein [Oscillospiraceae bacterium]
MKLIRTQDAVGHVLCHDMTQIIPGQYKDARFRKGHVVRQEDIPILLSMGKENLYVWELAPGMVHENEAAERLCALCENQYMVRGQVKEGKLELSAAADGLLRVDTRRLDAINLLGDLMIATRHGNRPVRKGDKLCGTRIIPLVIEEEKLARAEAVGRGGPLLELLPWKRKTAAIIATGSEVSKGLVEDAFTPVVKQKLAEYGIETIRTAAPGDATADISREILAAKDAGTDLILCTGGMSVDPDDRTPGAIRDALGRRGPGSGGPGAGIVAYGAPVLPGAMFLLGYFADGTPVMGLPGCVMYARRTIFDLILPRVAAGIPVTQEDIARLGEGGLCLGCETCVFPNCGFGL